MRTLNRSEIVGALMILGLYILFFFFADPIFKFIYTSSGKEYLQDLAGYRILFFIAFAALIIVFFISRYHKKVSTLEKQYYGLFDSNPIPMSIVDIGSLKFVAANQAAMTMYGYSREEFLTLSVADIRVKEELELIYEDIKTMNPLLQDSGIRHHRKKDGQIIRAEVTLGEVIFNNKRCLLLSASAVTEIIKAEEEKNLVEEEANRSQQFVSYVLENFPVDVAVFDKDHRYILLNKTAVRNDEMRKWMIGKDDFDYFALKGKDLSMAEKRREKFLRAIEGHPEEWIDEHSVDGKLKYVLRNFYPYYENGELKYVYGYGTDITEVKIAQLQREEYIEQLEKLAFTTSHKVRQPICNIKGLISIIEMGEYDKKQFDEVVTSLRASIGHLDEFTRDLGVRLHEYKQNLSKKDDDSKKQLLP